MKFRIKWFNGPQRDELGFSAGSARSGFGIWLHTKTGRLRLHAGRIDGLSGPTWHIHVGPLTLARWA